MNNALLKDSTFNNSIINSIIKELLTNVSTDYKEIWEYFKYKSRLLAIKRCKVLKASRIQIEHNLFCRLYELSSKGNVTEDEKLELAKISSQINELYLVFAKGAYIRSRAKWLEEGERSSSYFFALEKKKWKEKISISSSYQWGSV